MKNRKQQHNWLMLLVGKGYITLSISILLFGCVSAVTDSSRVLAKDDSSKIAQSPGATKENAERLFEEGMTLYQQGSAESLRQAIQKLQEALSLYRVMNDKKNEANTLVWIGRVYSDLGEKQKALDFFNQALSLMWAVGDTLPRNRPVEATTLNNIGLVYFNLGEKQKALDFFNQALPILRAVSNRPVEATTLNNIGAVYSALGEKEKALDYYNQALPIYRSVGDSSGEAGTLNNIGFVYSDLGEKQKALDYYNQALPLIRAVGDPSGEATILDNIRALGGF
jgi:tetratricopeptide (TPR) repeat protein